MRLFVDGVPVAPDYDLLELRNRRAIRGASIALFLPLGFIAALAFGGLGTLATGTVAVVAWALLESTAPWGLAFLALGWLAGLLGVVTGSRVRTLLLIE
jgi:hypothetical protein